MEKFGRLYSMKRGEQDLEKASLQVYGWSKLKRLASTHGLTEAQIDQCLEQCSPKGALIELLAPVHTCAFYNIEHSHTPLELHYSLLCVLL